MATVEQIPGELDITVVQGDDYSIQLTEAVNYSGYTFIANVHELNGGLSTCTTSLVSSAASSTVQVDFPSSLTSALAVTGSDGSHNWKCVQTDTSGLTRTWVKGAFKVLTQI